MKRIKTGDKVKIMTGSLKGKVAEVERLDGSRVYLKGIGLPPTTRAANEMFICRLISVTLLYWLMISRLR